MATRNVVLTEHMEKMINDLVLTGRYQNASEVMREGLRMLEQREAEQQAKLDALREATSLGLMQLEQGQYTEVSREDLKSFIDSIGNDVERSISESR